MRPIGGSEELKMRSGNEERRNHKRHKGADSICASCGSFFSSFCIPSEEQEFNRRIRNPAAGLSNK